MIAYASRTGTRRHLRALAAAGWRLFVSASAAHLQSEGFPYALDNGAWHAFQNGSPHLDEARFAFALAKLGAGADFVVVPDIVAGGAASLALSRRWLPRVLDQTQRALVAVQDGIMPADIRDLVGERVGIFIGGTTEWKEQSLPIWGELRRAAGCYLHVGRVNSARRIALCAAAAAHSFDGSGVSAHLEKLPRLENARRQPDLFA
jgi:hypothetical protein